MPQLDTGTLLLGAILLAMALATVAYVAVTAIRGQRRDAARLGAIGFVRSSFASRLDRTIPLNEVLRDMTESLRRNLGLDAAEVWTASAGVLERTVSDPERGPARFPLTPSDESIVAHAPVSGIAWAKVWLPAVLAGRNGATVRIAPVSHTGHLLGLIVAERRAGAPALPGEADGTLKELAREVGVAINNARLDSALEATLEDLRQHAEALEASRARIVAAADAERRRIERDIHDGVQQYLVAISVKARLARQMSERDPARASRLLEELGQEISKALDELRTLAHGIYPPLLASEGLGAAMVAASRRAVIPTQVHADGIGRYPPELEAAVYFCCLEALQNAGKYAGEGATATVRIQQENDKLVFEVQDSGAGFDVTSQGRGAGMTNMMDRVGAVGGSLRVESSPGGGTTVGASIPLRAALTEP
ncbi:MAG: GAF domain-containing sensor histidine kinase [Chloroflexi bacterium]|nr:MAG: GAF domain-containing sensor histidine kinase [Chloroflexota bacterium]